MDDDDGRWKREEEKRTKIRVRVFHFVKQSPKIIKMTPKSGDSASFLSSDFSMSIFLLIFVSVFEVMPSKNQGNFLHRARLQPIVCGLKLAICVRFLNIETGTEY